MFHVKLCLANPGLPLPEKFIMFQSLESRKLTLWHYNSLYGRLPRPSRRFVDARHPVNFLLRPLRLRGFAHMQAAPVLARKLVVTRCCPARMLRAVAQLMFMPSSTSRRRIT